MSERPNTNLLEELLEQQRVEAGLRYDSLGPIIEAVGMLRDCCALIRTALDEMESAVGVHLELLDAVMVMRHGSRWWLDLPADDPKEGDW